MQNLDAGEDIHSIAATLRRIYLSFVTCSHLPVKSSEGVDKWQTPKTDPCQRESQYQKEYATRMEPRSIFSVSIHRIAGKFDAELQVL